MSYDYLVFRAAHRLRCRTEIDEKAIVPFVSNDAILLLLRRLFPEAQVDGEGRGWLQPQTCMGAIRLSDEEPLIFHLARITPPEIQVLCTALNLTALDLQTMTLIQPEEAGSLRS